MVCVCVCVCVSERERWDGGNEWYVCECVWVGESVELVGVGIETMGWGE